MAEDIYLVCVFNIDPNKFAEFQKVVAPHRGCNPKRSRVHGV
jgi:hypothetical protein